MSIKTDLNTLFNTAFLTDEEAIEYKQRAEDKDYKDVAKELSELSLKYPILTEDCQGGYHLWKEKGEWSDCGCCGGDKHKYLYHYCTVCEKHFHDEHGDFNYAIALLSRNTGIVHTKGLKMINPANLNIDFTWLDLSKEATEDLYQACLNATGAYQALKALGADRELPGYDRCLEFLNKAIAKAQGKDKEIKL